MINTFVVHFTLGRAEDLLDLGDGLLDFFSLFVFFFHFFRVSDVFDQERLGVGALGFEEPVEFRLRVFLPLAAGFCELLLVIGIFSLAWWNVLVLIALVVLIEVFFIGKEEVGEI